MDLCMICSKCVNNSTVSIYDVIDGIKIKDILYDLNYKFPFGEKCLSDKLCFECCINVVEFYNFRENCCFWFDIEEETNVNNCRICRESKLFLNSVFIKEDSLKITDVLSEICAYNLNIECTDKLCMNCYESLMKNYSFHLACQKAVNFWANRILHLLNHSPKQKIKKKTEPGKSSFKKDSDYLFQKKFSKYYSVNKPFKCNLCSKTFKNPNRLKKHSRVHSREKQFLCEICSKSCPSYSVLKVHLRIHTGEKPYLCEVCSRAFTRRGHLNQHLMTHTGNKPHQCDICSKLFESNSKLKRHQRAHTGEKPHQCEVCSKTFTRSDNLKVHLRTHTGEEPFRCAVCCKTFAYSSTLRQHLKLHDQNLQS